ncbi:MAG: DUF2142 domain-containing protein [Actinomycetes bacterium]
MSSLEDNDDRPRDSVLDRASSFCTGTDRRLWWLVVAVVGAMIACWSIGMPYFSGPDEPLHASRAWSVVHGQIIGEETNIGGFRLVEAPEWLDADRNDTSCYRFDPEQIAGCFSLEPSSDIVTTRTQGAQQPLYYAIVGWPFRFSDHGLSLILVRIWSGFLTAALIASTVVTARNSEFRRWLLPATLLACTPMVFYISGVMNPSGMEIASGLLLWVVSISIFCDRRIYGRLFWRFAAAASLLILVRQLGPLWFVVIFASCVLLSTVERLKELLRMRQFRLAALAVAASGVLWASWSYFVKPLAIADSGFGVDGTTTGLLRLQIGRLWSVIQEAVGVFGWIEVRLPLAVYLIWIVGVLLFVGFALTFGSGKYAVAPILVLLGAIVLQTLGEFSTLRELGFMWQGRYTLPVLVGVPLVAALAIGRAKPAIKVSSVSKWTGGVLLWAALCLSFHQAERRYMVGSSGPYRIWDYGAWNPPVPVILLLVGFAVTAAMWVLICAASTKYVGPSLSNDGNLSK